MSNKTVYAIFLCLFIYNSPIIPEGFGPMEVTGTYKYTYDSALGPQNELSLYGVQDLSENTLLSAGFSTAFNSLPEAFFLKFALNNYPSFLRYSINLLSRDFPDYEVKENSLYPTISLITKYFELEIGMSMRILEADIQMVTYHTLYRLQFNILDLKKYGLLFRMSNFDNFRAGNINELYYTVENSLKVNDQFIIRLDMGFQNAGQLSFTSYYSKFFAQVGLRYKP